MRVTRVLQLAATLASLTGGCGFGDLRFDRQGAGGAGSGGATASSSSSAGTTSSHTSASATANSGGGPTETDCTDGVDNDGDGLTDCDDPDCTGLGFACVPGAPSGWTGPVALYEGPAQNLPACGGAYPMTFYQGSSGIVAPDAQCNPCFCGPGSGTCHLTAVSAFADPACTVPVANQSYSVLNGNNCGIAHADQALSFMAAAPTVDGATCAPAGGGVGPLGTPSWTTTTLACGGPVGSCGQSGTSVCAPPPAAPYGGSVCMIRSGDVSCPLGYPQKHTVGDDTSFTDTRGCSACGCGTPATSDCTLTYRLYHLNGCGNLVIALPADGACHPAQAMNLDVNAYSAKTTVSVGPCPPTGGAPTGAVTPGKPTTVCCR
jgi:hypothetical protein